jgi:hypothetical protein
MVDMAWDPQAQERDGEHKRRSKPARHDLLPWALHGSTLDINRIRYYSERHPGCVGGALAGRVTLLFRPYALEDICFTRTHGRDTVRKNLDPRSNNKLLTKSFVVNCGTERLT